MHSDLNLKINKIFGLRQNPLHADSSDRQSFEDRERIFHKNPDVLVMGCSMSDATSLPMNFSWPSIVNRLTKEKINNVSKRGSSVCYLISLGFDNIEKYGMPKKIYAFLPDLLRFSVPVMENIEKAEQESKNPDQITNKILENQIHWVYNQYEDHLQNKSLFVFKDFQNQKHTFPLEIAIYHNIMSIKALQILCKQTGTELKISSWSSNTYPIIEQIAGENAVTASKRYTFNKEIEYLITHENFGDPESQKCGHRPANKQQADLWMVAEDNCHAGLHHQIHFAEMFTNQEIPQSFIEKL
jgi:hypothetical protein